MASPGAAAAAGFRPSTAVVLYRRILRSLRGFEDGGQRWYYRNWSRGRQAVASGVGGGCFAPSWVWAAAVARPLLQSVPVGFPWSNTHPPNHNTGHIQSHSDEDDGERLKFLLAKGEEHRLWVLRKYQKPDPYSMR